MSFSWTHTSFLGEVQNYYGGYHTEAAAARTFEWVSDHVAEIDLAGLFTALVENHPMNWGAPDIAAIRKNYDQLKTRRIRESDKHRVDREPPRDFGSMKGGNFDRAKRIFGSVDGYLAAFRKAKSEQPDLTSEDFLAGAE
jgi:hypothetical protein